MKKIFLACGIIVSSYASWDAYFSHLQKKTDFDFSKIHNPFANPTLQHIAHIKIQAIFPHKAKINDVWYRQNDTLGEAIIKRIEAKAVVFEYDGEQISVALENDKMAIH